jgi:phospholipid/cholesterol/gamma-HCH transport system substrate-binding protein
LVTDTVVFNSMKASVAELKVIADSASAFVNNLKEASQNRKSPVGVMLHDEPTANNLKETIKNLDSSTAKLNRDLEALQYSFLLRGAYKKQAKANAKGKVLNK